MVYGGSAGHGGPPASQNPPSLDPGHIIGPILGPIIGPPKSNYFSSAARTTPSFGGRPSQTAPATVR